MSGIVLWLDRIAVMTLKELKQLTRDPILLIVIGYFFTADIYIAGTGISIDLRNAPIAVIDRDHSAASRELIYRFQPPYFRFQQEIDSGREAVRLLDEGKDLMAGRQVAVQMQVDASNATLGTLATSYAARIVGRFGMEMAERGMGTAQLQALPMVEDRQRVYYNPNQADPWFMSISELLMVITMLSPAAAAVREKERGTIEQLAVSPLTPTQILLPKVLAMGLAVMGGVAAALFLIIEPIFQVPIKGSIPLFFLATALPSAATWDRW